MDGVLHTPQANVVGVCSRSACNARRVADQYGIGKIYTSLKALAEDPEVDAVYLATPNSCHRDQAIQMLASGKHVFVEKPAVTNLADYQAVMAAAHAAGKVVMEAMRPVHGPAVTQLREWIAQLGQVRCVHLHSGKYSSRYDAFRQGDVLNAFNSALQNSALMDMGVYAVQFLIALFGLPQQVSARAIRLHNGFEGAGSVICSYDGMLANVTYSKISDAYRGNEIQGEDGTLVFDSVGAPQAVTLYRRGEAPRTLHARLSGDHPMQYEVADFCAAVEGTLDPRPCQQWTHDTISLMDEIRRQTGVTFG